MTMANRVQDYIARHKISCDAVTHRASQSMLEAARAAGVPPERLAKAVVLVDRSGYVVSVVPAHQKLDVAQIGAALGRDLRLASEADLRELFGDCEYGAVPPLGMAYGIPTVWDPRLGEKPDVYFEGGDHCTLVHTSGAGFRELMRAAQPLPAFP
jgi:Ala-tRNA(Pro) deacylase